MAAHMLFMKTPVIEAQSSRENEYDSVDDYIEEVCKTNHIYDGKITDGMYLVVPYYTTKQEISAR